MIFPLHKPFIVAKNRIILVFHFLKQKRQKKKKTYNAAKDALRGK